MAELFDSAISPRFYQGSTAMKMLLVGLAIAAAAIGGGVGYTAMQTTSLPDWYSQAQSDQKTDRLEGSDAVVIEPVNAAPGDTVISSGELDQMVTDALASQPYTAPLLEVAKGVNTSITKGRIESGLVMNLSEIPLESLPVEGQQAVEQLTQKFPILANRDVYIGLEGRPEVVDGALSLDDTHLKIGQMKLPIGSIASQLGLSQAEIEGQLGALLQQQGIAPEAVQIVDGQLVLTGLSQ
ncbi:MAG: hypothetical protein DCF25_17235 [Leptolyngbya foveolarum]|uniref:Uncharacterized protein n=1 Tax=Leptolyngbya foveolarum TaxID=47253 RepID=A0A2W4U629_9CYAN|nr:MAG: hypothetical protein DCF25_17235 [Leptolyngbya foveolarum]